MDINTLFAGAALSAGQIIVIDLAGNIRIANIGDPLLPGEVVVDPNGELASSSVLFIDEESQPQDVTGDIEQVFAALESGADPTQLEEDEFSTAAGGPAGSSLTTSAAVDRDGIEKLASTNFITQGFDSSLSRFQLETLIDNVAPEAPTVTILEDINNDGVIDSTEADGPVQVLVTVGAGTFPGDILSVTGQPDVELTQADIDNGVVFEYPQPEGDTVIEVIATVTDSNGNTSPQGSDSAYIPPEIASVAVTEVTEGEDLTFTVTLSSPAQEAVNYPIDLPISDDVSEDLVSFTNGVTLNDDGTITVPAGVTDFEIVIPTIDDDIVEATETYTISVDGMPADGGILDNDKPEITSVEFNPAAEGDSVVEGNDLNFVVTLSEETLSPVTYPIDLPISDDVSEELVSFTNGVTLNDDGTITVPAGVTDFEIVIPTIDDDIVEATETYTISVDGMPADGGILDNDKPEITSVEFNPAAEGDSVVEGNDLNFVVTLSEETLSPVTYPIDLPISDDVSEELVSFTNGVTLNDDGTITVPAGVTDFEIVIPTIDDDIVEATETYTISVDGVPADGGILDNDKPEITSVEFNPAADGDSVVEGNDLNFVVTLSEETLSPVTYPIDLPISDDVSEELVSFTNGVTLNDDGTITVPAGVTDFEIVIPTIDDDIVEATETYTISVDGMPADGGILDNDKPEITSVEFNPAADGDSVVEGNDLNFVVTLSEETLSPVTYPIDLPISDDVSEELVSFTNGVTLNDDGTITVPAGVTDFEIVIPTIDDDIVEATETYTISVDGMPADGGILDNDKPEITSVEFNPAAEGDSVVEGNDLNFVVTLSEETLSPVTYPIDLPISGDVSEELVSFTNGVTLNDDGTITVPAGVTDFEIVIPTIDDDIVEATETYTISVDGIPADGGILDNDKPSIDSIVVDGDSVVEGNDLNFVVTLSETTLSPVTYDITLPSSSDVDVSAITFTNDVVLNQDGTITVPVGVTTFSIVAPTIDDTIVEATEEYVITVDTTPSTGFILDNDKPSIDSIMVDGDSVVEGNNLNFVVTLSETTLSPVTYDITLPSSSDVDVSAITFTNDVILNQDGTITVPVGVTTFSIVAPTIDDTIVEATEEYVITLDTTPSTGFILDNDKPSIDSIMVDGDSVVEGNNLNFVVTLSETTLSPVTYDITLPSSSDVDVSAITFTNDVVLNQDGTITVPVGVTTFSIVAPTIDDTIVEATEEYVITVDTTPSTGFIFDNDKPSIDSIMVDGDSVVEGNNLNFVVTLSETTLSPVTYDITLPSSSDVDVSAITFTNDVILNQDGTITVPVGVTTFSIVAPTIDDTIVEATEEYVITLDTTPSTGFILDNDKPSIDSIMVDGDSVVEGNNLNFVVTLSETTLSPVTYDITLPSSSDVDVSAITFTNDVILNQDGTITVPVGVTTFSIVAPTIDDTIVEATEEYVITLDTTPSTGFILDNDKPSIDSIMVDGDSVVEGNNLNFVVTLSETTLSPVTYDITLPSSSDVDVSAITFTNDVVLNQDGTITVPVGVTTFSIVAPTIDDTIVEATEEYVITLDTTPSTGFILDNDKPSIDSIMVDGDSVVEGNNLNFVVTLSETTLSPVTYDITLPSSSDVDVSAITFTNDVVLNQDGTITVPVGVMTFSIVAPTIDDTIVEATEEYVITVDTTPSTGFILDNDKPSIDSIMVDGDSVVEGNDLNFVVTLSETTLSPVTYDITLPSSSDVDVSAITFTNDVILNQDGTITVPVGVTTFSIVAPTIDDTIVEATEEYVITLDTTPSTGFILDNDKPSIDSIMVDGDSVVEGNNLNFVVTLSETTLSPVTYDITLPSSSDVDVSAITFTNDVVLNQDGTITVPVGVTTFSIVAPTIDDTIVEATEEYVITLDTTPSTGFILDNDKPSIDSIMVDGDSVVEGNNLNFVVTLSETTLSPVTYDITLPSSSDVDVSAITFTNDVVLNQDGTITVPVGVMTFSIVAPTIDDTIVEATEEYVITVDTTPSTGFILDNDKPSIDSIMVDGDSVVEGNDLNFVVTLSETTLSPVTYDITLPSSSDVDVSAITFTNDVILNQDGTITVPVGVTTFSIVAPTIDDTIVEATEEYVITLDTTPSTGFILDNDKPSIDSIMVDGDSVVEGNNLNFVVTLSETTLSPVTYDITLPSSSDVDVSAITFTNDVVLNQDGTITVPVGVMTFSIVAPTIDDTIVEATEEYVITVDTTPSTGFILDNDKPSIDSIMVDGDSVVEGNDLNFVVTLSETTLSPVTYDITLPSSSDVDVSAITFTNDVILNQDGTITVPVGVTTFSIVAPTIDDTIVEATEEYVITLDTTPSTGFILDNDKPSIDSIMVDGDSVVEGNNLNFVVTLSETTLSPVTYDITLPSSSDVDVSAITFTNDVVLNQDGTITVPVGVMTFSIVAPTIDDTIVEATEEYVITVDTTPSTGFILDNDKPSIDSIMVDGDSVVEGNDLNFVVTLSETTLSPVTYDITLPSSSDVDVSAITFTNDVVLNQDGTITVPMGVTTFSIVAPTIDDTIVEATEEYVITVDTTPSTGFIFDNDKPSIDSIMVDGDSVVEGNNLNFVVTLSETTLSPVTYDITLPSSSDVDVSAITFTNDVILNQDGTITVPVGVTTFSIVAPTIDDTIVEATEEYVITLDTTSSTGLILDNDFAPTASGGHVVGQEDTLYTFTWSDFNAQDQNVDDNLSVTLTSIPAAGLLQQNINGVWTDVTSLGANGLTLTQEQIDSGDLRFLPDTNESSINTTDDVASSLGNNQVEYAEFGYTVTDGLNVSDAAIMSLDIEAIADTPKINVEGVDTTASINFEDVVLNGRWGNVDINDISGTQTVGVWGSSNNGQVEIGQENVYKNGGDPTNLVLEVESDSADDIVFTDVVVEEGKFYNFTFDITGRDGRIANGDSDLNIGWQQLDANGVPTGNVEILYEFRPQDGTWLRDQNVTLPSDVEGTFRLMLMATDSNSYGALVDNLLVTTSDSVGYEDTPIAMPDIETLACDHDSETITSLTISGLPEGTILRDGDNFIVIGPNDNPLDITNWDLDNLIIQMEDPGQYTFTLTSTATEFSNGDTATTTTPLTLRVLERPFDPEVGNSTADLSESGLAMGIASIQGDVISHNGTISVSDNNNDIETVQLIAPAEDLYSGGELVIWTLSNDGQTLTGSNSTGDVIVANIDDEGNYDVEMLQHFDHNTADSDDILMLDIGVVATDSLGQTDMGTITLNIADDNPETESIDHNVNAETKQGTNIQLLLDVSGSMGTDDAGVDANGNKVTRLDVMKSSALQLLNQYDSIGATRVQLISFSVSANVLANDNGLVWMSISDATNIINGLGAGGVTNYADTALDAASSWGQDSAEKLDISTSTNVTYFLSDGQPYPDDNALTPTEQTAWEKFLNDNEITGLAYGMGNGAPVEELATMSYNGFGPGSDIAPVVVPDVSQLPPVLLQSVVEPVSGNLLTDQLGGTVSGTGSDGGYVSSISLNGNTYAYDGSTVTATETNAAITFAFDSQLDQLSVYIDNLHSFVINVETGDYQFFGAASDADVVFDFGYAITDGDGDTSSNTLSFTIDGDDSFSLDGDNLDNTIIGDRSDETLSGNDGNDGIDGGSGDDILFGGDGEDVLVGGLGADILTGGNNADIFKWVDSTLDNTTDTIMDFQRGEDMLDFTDLLDETNTASVDDLLATIDVQVDGDDINLVIPHGGDNQTIVIKDGATEFNDLITSSGGADSISGAQLTDFWNNVIINPDS